MPDFAEMLAKKKAFAASIAGSTNAKPPPTPQQIAGTDGQ